MSFDDRGRFDLEWEVVSASVKLSICYGGDSLTPKKTHHVESKIKSIIKGN